MSIYSQLLKYQESDKRSNEENYFTEILCDYLNRLSEKDTREFIKIVVFYEHKISSFNEFSQQNDLDNDEKNIVWKTQYSVGIDGTIKFPDLVGFIGNIPFIIIEVKIGAGFTHRIHKDIDGKEVSTSQLVDYGNWLNDQNPNAVLILLTHSTTPPEDFLEVNKTYGVQQKNYITWQNIYNWLKTVNSELCLTKDFINFLTERSMANQSPNYNDLSTLNIFMSGAGERIQHMMESVRKALEEKYTINMNWGLEKSSQMGGAYAFAYDQRLAWSWVILQGNDYSYIAWGICYPEEQDDWEWRRCFPLLPKKPFVFVGIFSSGNNTQKICHNKTGLQPDGWMWSNKPNSELVGINALSLDEFISFDTDMATDLCAFVDKGFGDIMPMVDEVVK